MCAQKTHLPGSQKESNGSSPEIQQLSHSYLKKVYSTKYCKPLENIRKIWYNFRYNVGAGIPVGVYVVAAHRYQEMMICQITISAGIVFCLAGETQYSILYILPHSANRVKGFFEKSFSILKITDAVRPTPHQSSDDDRFSSKEKPDEFGKMPKLFPLKMGGLMSLHNF